MVLVTVTAISAGSRQGQVLRSCCSMSCRGKWVSRWSCILRLQSAQQLPALLDCCGIFRRNQVWLMVAQGIIVCTGRQGSAMPGS